MFLTTESWYEEDWIDRASTSGVEPASSTKNPVDQQNIGEGLGGERGFVVERVALSG